MARPNPSAGQQQPVSFKTVPGRNRTQKWQQAKTYNYDGDEWGGYDPYEEYGDYDEPEPEPEPEPAPAPAPAPPMPPYAQQRPQRQNSFDTGDERREFSGPHMGYAGEERRGSPAVSSGSGRPSGDYARASNARGSNDYDRRARDRNFTNPEQVPPPLNTHTSPVRAPAGGQSAGAFPPRKSSISQSSSRSPAREPVSAPPVAATTAATTAAKSVDKPLPFIRPSDIYRRMAEERERERTSMDSSRPSRDSVQNNAPASSSPPPAAGGLAGGRDATDSPASASGRRPSLETVMERRELEAARQAAPTASLPAAAESRQSAHDLEVPAADMQQEAEYKPLSSLQTSGSGFGEPRGKATQEVSPVLPPVTRFSGFGSDFIHGTPADSAADDEATPRTPAQHVQSTISRVFNAPVVYSADGATETTAPHEQSEETMNAAPNPQTASLQHQPSTASTGFRSVVHTAFDRHSDSSSISTTPLSRDGSNSHPLANGRSGVSRSDTTSTAGISPIVSRVPSAATAQQRRSERGGAHVPPPISAEPASARTPTQERAVDGTYLPRNSPPQQQQQQQQQGHFIPRKPSPNHTPTHSRNVSAETAGIVQPGYRRSLDPPSHGSSPARTPGLEDSSTDRRLSAPMAAEVAGVQETEVGDERETPDVIDQAAEMPTAHLERAETPAREKGEPMADDLTQPLEIEREETGPHAAVAAAEAGGYSTREADLANSVNASPDKASFSPAVAEAETTTQQHFLRTHTSSPSSPASPGLAGGFGRPVSPGIAAQGLGIARTSTPAGMAATGGSGRESPATKGRVREIAEKYTSLDDASRRNSGASIVSSKSSWSRFGGSEENLALKRKGTGGSASLLGGESGNGEQEVEVAHGSPDRGAPKAMLAASAGLGMGRPAVESQASFRPHLPGEWVSFAGTPASEQAPTVVNEGSGRSLDERQQHEQASSPLTPRASQIAEQDEEPVDLTPTRKTTQARDYQRETYPDLARETHDLSTSRVEDDEPIDLTPTTRKTQLRGPSSPSSPSSPQMNNNNDNLSSTFTQQVKSAGTALGASLMSMGGLTSHARDFGSAEPAPPVAQPEMAAKVPYGSVEARARPVVPREESEMSVMTEGGGSVSGGSEGPPTPPAKDDGSGENEGEGAGAAVNAGQGGRPISGYFSGAVPPLRTGGHSREGLREVGEARGQGQGERPAVLPTLSSDTGFEDLESDRLRKEIVRSLDPAKRERMKRESILEQREQEDVERGQDALDQRENARRVEGGGSAMPAAEAQAEGRDEKPLPRMLDQRFSWEKRPEAQSALQVGPPPPAVVEPKVPEVAPEAPYERPHSRNLHVMNANADSDTDEEESPLRQHVELAKVGERGGMDSLPVSAATDSLGMSPLVSPISRSREDLTRDGRVRELAPSPVEDRALRHESGASSEARLPSYYQSDVPEAGAAPASRSQQPPPEQAAEASTPATPTAAKRTSQRVPPFREILAIKSSPDRIKTFDETRQRFAEMDTGLRDWLSGMMAQHPEHATNVSSSAPLGATPTGGLRTSSGTFKHRASPSLIKFTRQFTNTTTSSSSSVPSEAAIRKASVGVGGAGAGEGGDGDAAPPKTPSKSRMPVEQIDVEKMQQKGKDLMKSVGGRAQAGAKGLFQRGKSRFGRGGDTAPTPPSKSSSAASTPPPPSRSPYRPPAASSTSSLRFASAGASGPLSQAFSRLRERSRSKSTSRSKSRPASLVITNPDLLLDSDDARTFRAATAGAVVPSGFAEGRREVWDEPGEDAGASEVGVRSGTGTPARLGLLPSPGLETFPGHRESPTKRSGSVERLLGERGEKSARDVGGERGVRDETANTPLAPDADNVIAVDNLRPAEERGSVPVTVSSNRSVAAPQAERPQHERKISALADLPSQRARGLDSPQSPGPKLAIAPDHDDELYESTPVAPTARRRRSSDPQEAQTTSTGTENATMPVPPEHSEVSRPTTADAEADGQRSEVSAEEEREAAKDSKGPDEAINVGSRRSSISSLGSPDTVVGKRVSRILRDRDRSDAESSTERPSMTAQAVPVGPINSGATPRDRTAGHDGVTEASRELMQPPVQQSDSARVTSPDQQTFMERSYRGRVAPPNQVMSYMPLGRHENGAPVQEELDTDLGEPLPSVDLSAFSGPPPTTPPFQPHPFFRNSGFVPQNEYDKLRSSQVGTATPSTQRSRQVGADASKRSSKPYSRFFRGPEVLPDTAAGAPAPHAMSPNYGLEDLDTAGAEAMLNEEETKPSKRRSGLWEAFKRSPSASKTRFGGDGNIAPSDARGQFVTAPASSAVPRAQDNTAQPKILMKPQRAASAATPPTEPKKKRFSGFGSLFGRSSTHGHNTPKPKKLTKMQPPSRESSVRQSIAPGASAQGYDTFERMRRQQVPDLQQRPQDTRYPPSTALSPQQQPPVDTDAPFANVPRGLPQPSHPPPQGWYSPTGDPSPVDHSPHAQPPMPMQWSDPRSQYRRLHSASSQRGLQQASIPEAFRPVEASYGKQAAPVGPPPEHQPPVMYCPPSHPQHPTLPTQQPYWNGARIASDQGPASSTSRQRQVSAGSGGYALSPQISGQSDYEHPSWRRDDSLPSPSPVQLTAKSQTMPPLRTQRIGSLGQEMARSPAQQYADQQNPFAVSVPGYDNGSQRPSRASSWATQPGIEPDLADYPATVSAPSQASYASRGLPMSPQSPSLGQPYQIPSSGQSQLPWQLATYPDPYMRDIANIQGHSYPSPPYTPQSAPNQGQPRYGPPEPFAQYSQGRYTSPLPPPSQQPPPPQRYYSQTQLPKGLMPQARPLTYQRTHSGYSGRRDDATVSEQELGMRGASYPGQEWAPHM